MTRHWRTSVFISSIVSVFPSVFSVLNAEQLASKCADTTFTSVSFKSLTPLDESSRRSCSTQQHGV